MVSVPANRWSTWTGVPAPASYNSAVSPSGRPLLPPPQHLNDGLVRMGVCVDEMKETWHRIILVAEMVDHWVPVQRGHVRLVAVRCFLSLLSFLSL